MSDQYDSYTSDMLANPAELNQINLAEDPIQYLKENTEVTK